MKKNILILVVIMLFTTTSAFAQVYTYTDDYAKITFDVDEAIWKEAELLKAENHISNKWETKCGTLMYGATDVYDSLSYEVKEWGNREQINDLMIDTNFAKDYINNYSEMLNIDEWLIQRYNLNFIDFYGTTNYRGINMNFDFFVTINNGYLIIFQYYGDGCANCISEIEKVAKSVKIKKGLAESVLNGEFGTSENKKGLAEDIKNGTFQSVSKSQSEKLAESIINGTYESSMINVPNNTKAYEEIQSVIVQLSVMFLITLLCYMLYPILRIIINKGRFNNEIAHKIALWNSIVVGVIFMILTIANGEYWTGAVIYYSINKAILTKKEEKLPKEDITNAKEDIETKKREVQHICLSKDNKNIVKKRGMTYSDDVLIQKEDIEDECNELIKRIDEIKRKIESKDK